MKYYSFLKNNATSQQLLAEYAYAVQKGGIVYTATDVEDLHKWMVQHFDAHPLFERIPDQQLVSGNGKIFELIVWPKKKEGDVCVPLVLKSSEEAKKVEKASGSKFLAVYRRV